MSAPLSSAQRETLLHTLQARFDGTMAYHPVTAWDTVLTALDSMPQALQTLFAMDTSGGEPTVVDDPEHPGKIVFMDAAAESPAGRRSLCYDHEALLSRKSNPPLDSVVHMAETMGVEIMTEAQYRALQHLGAFDEKTSSWIRTPAAVRALGGALFCDRRYGQIFTYHNGADAYYGSRGFRGCLVL